MQQGLNHFYKIDLRSWYGIETDEKGTSIWTTQGYNIQRYYGWTDSYSSSVILKKLFAGTGYHRNII